MKRVTENGLVVKVLRRILGQIQDWSLGETKGFSMILGDKKEKTVFSKDVPKNRETIMDKMTVLTFMVLVRMLKYKQILQYSNRAETRGPWFPYQPHQ